MSLKYLDRKEIPYFHEYCTFENVPMTDNDIIQFKDELDKFKYQRIVEEIRRNPSDSSPLTGFFQDILKKASDKNALRDKIRNPEWRKAYY